MLAEVDKLTEKLKTYTLADMVKLAYMLVKETYKLQHCLTKHARKKNCLEKISIAKIPRKNYYFL